MIDAAIHVIFAVFICVSVAWNVFAMKRMAFLYRRIESTHERISSLAAVGRYLRRPSL